MGLSSTLRGIVERSFAVPQARYEAELASHNAALRFDDRFAFRSEVRPKFFTGNPDALKPRSYLLTLSLNHKYKRSRRIDEEIAALNSSPASHYDACAHYFEQRRSYRFFGGFRPVLEGMGYQQLGPEEQVFFMEALPFFSDRSRSLSRAEIQSLNGTFVELNHEAVKAVITDCPPTALYLNGQSASTSLEAWAVKPIEWRQHHLDNVTAVGRCIVESASLEIFGVSIRAVRSNFLRSRYGPNSTEQCRELGALLVAGAQATDGRTSSRPPQ